MTSEEKELLRERIVGKIAQIGKEMIHLEENTKPISPENSIGRISRMDAINNKGVAEAALRSSKKKLEKLKIALTKIGQTDFGTCTSCGKIIQAARLMFMPESTKCVRCADRQ